MIHRFFMQVDQAGVVVWGDGRHEFRAGERKGLFERAFVPESERMIEFRQISSRWKSQKFHNALESEFVTPLGLRLL